MTTSGAEGAALAGASAGAAAAACVAACFSTGVAEAVGAGWVGGGAADR